MNSVEKVMLEQRVIEQLRTCFDPEIPVDIYELGLVYGLHIDDDGRVAIRMTLTAPNCPVAGSLPAEIEDKIGKVEGVTGAAVELVWTPPWSPDRMSEAAKLTLGMM